ncbi:MAG: hypothetical protein MH204_09490 [Fimbriimonadaceae bacterium]|nr:hypothetical protein [Fimbriimonadaceae bacterium]
MAGGFSAILQAVKKNAGPISLITGIAVFLAVGYYTLSPVRVAMESVAGLREPLGLLFPGLTNLGASLVIPWTARFLMGRAKGFNLSDLGFQAVLFFISAYLVYSLYTVQAIWFAGLEPWLRVPVKVAVDMILFSPLISIPYFACMILLRKGGWKPGAVVQGWKSGEFRQIWWSNITACWAFWTPVLFAVYAVPDSLQFVLFLFLQAAWTFIVFFINPEAVRGEASAEGPA